MSALLVSEVSRRRDYWRNTAVTPTKIQSSWRGIFVDRSYHTEPLLVGWSATLPLSDYGRVARHSAGNRNLAARLHTRGLAEYRRHLPIRLAKPAWDPYSMHVSRVVQKLPAPAATLRWQKVKAHPDQTGLLQTERNAANGMRSRPQANPSHSQQPQAWRRNSG